jgi:monovalent cation/hydrogen antiporter
VSAGLVLGWQQHVVLPATARLRGTAFWRTMVFVLEAMVFILIGFSLRGVVERLGQDGAAPEGLIVPVVGVVVAIVVARVLWVFGVDGVLTGLKRIGLVRARPLGWRQASVLSWAGMRGVVTLAIALTLPADMPGRDLMLVAAFAVIFATVVIQGTSLGWLIRRVAPVDSDPPPRFDLAQSEARVARARYEAIRERAFGADGEAIHPQLLDQSEKRLNATERYAADANRFMEDIRPHFDVILASIEAGRAELIRLHRAGEIEDETLHDLERDLDVEAMAALLQRGA